MGEVEFISSYWQKSHTVFGKYISTIKQLKKLDADMKLTKSKEITFIYKKKSRTNPRTGFLKQKK